MKIVDKNLDIALHTQLYQIIKDMIESKELVVILTIILKLDNLAF